MVQDVLHNGPEGNMSSQSSTLTTPSITDGSASLAGPAPRRSPDNGLSLVQDSVSRPDADAAYWQVEVSSSSAATPTTSTQALITPTTPNADTSYGPSESSSSSTATQTASAPTQTALAPALPTPITPNGMQTNANGNVPDPPTPPPPPPPPPMAPVRPNSQSNRSAKEEWRSWKIQYPYLSVLLLLSFGFIFAIAALTAISRRDSGFARQSRLPLFFQHNPGLRKAIWEQGIIYTALPAFIMTVYRTMWDATVMAFADRQPYADLMKAGGRHPRRTILLDYKTEPLLRRWILAFQNKHFLLSACMLSSLVLSLGIVPLTSFLFTMDTSLSNSTFLLTTDTYFNGTIVTQFPVIPNEPNLRVILDTAAGLHVQNLSLPPRTDGTFAFPHFTPQVDVGSSNVSVHTAAYGVDSGWIEIPESEYDKKIRWYDNQISIDVHTIDRMCDVSKTLDIRTNPWSPEIWLSSWHTPTCSEEAGWTRMSLLAARYDRASQTVQDFSFLSCNASYFSTAGYLMQRLEPGLSPRFLRFDEDAQQKMELGWQDLYVTRMFLEKEVHNLRYLDPTPTADGNEFSKYVYRMAQFENPKGPLEPKALVTAAQTLYETVYAVFASVYLFQLRDIPLNGTGVYMIEEKRLFVQPVVAYIILGVLGATAVLIACLFLYSRQRSMLKEEPFGLMSYAGILFQSNINTNIMREIVDNGYDPRTARESAKKMYHLDQVRWLYDEASGRITFRGPFPMQTFTTNNGSVVPPRRNPFIADED